MSMDSHVIPKGGVPRSLIHLLIARTQWILLVVPAPTFLMLLLLAIRMRSSSLSIKIKYRLWGMLDTSLPGTHFSGLGSVCESAEGGMRAECLWMFADARSHEADGARTH
jgi:hypothetical protein